MKAPSLVAAAILSVSLINPVLAADKTKGSLKDALTAETTQLWQSFKDKKSDAFTALLADDFVNIDWSGVGGKADVSGGMGDFSDVDFKLDNFRFVRVEAKTAFVTYHVTFHGNYKGKQAGPTSFNATDVYTNRGGKWVDVLHTETAVPEGTP